MNKEDWQKVYIQPALDYHNKKYNKNITIVGRCEEIHPKLKGRRCWDWSAIDKNNGGEIAIEVKRLTNPKLQERFSELYKICRELSGELSGNLRGVFILSVEVFEEGHFDLRGVNKQRLKEKLKELVVNEARSMENRQERDLAAELRVRLPEVVPRDHCLRLLKLDNAGSYVSPSCPVTWWGPSGEPQGQDLIAFQKLVQDANRQLGEAKRKGISETFLILVELWFSGAEADVIQDTLRSFDPSDHNHIKFLYLVGSVAPPNIHELFFGNAHPYQEVSSHQKGGKTRSLP